MMLCMNTQIIRADLITLEWQTSRKRKHERERHCLGGADVASLLFILSEHSVILIPLPPAAIGQHGAVGCGAGSPGRSRPSIP